MGQEYLHLEHGFAPVVDENCRILILGSFPSVKSRENGFYYGHPSNRFWKVLAAVLEMDVPGTIEEKKVFLLSHHIALWDVIASCDIEGSADSTIKNVVPNDFDAIIKNSKVKRIFVNGKTAEKYYNKYTKDKLGRAAVCLPSTSPANAAWSIERLVGAWRIINE